MKRIKIGLVAAILALVMASFTRKPESKHEASGYWFQYNSAGTTILDATSPPVLMASDPFGCNGGTTNCAIEYDSFTMLSPSDYAPSGNVLQLDKRH
jgi:hypothetical protein